VEHGEQKAWWLAVGGAGMGTEAPDRHSVALRARERGANWRGGDRTGTAGWDLAAHRPDTPL